MPSATAVVPAPRAPNGATGTQRFPAVEPARARAVGRFTLDVTNEDGHRIATLEIVIRRESVETWFGHRCAGIADRDELRDWLFIGQGTHTVDEVTWSRSPDGQVRVAVHPALPAGPLPPDTVLDIRARL